MISWTPLILAFPYLSSTRLYKINNVLLQEKKEMANFQLYVYREMTVLIYYS